MFDTSLSVKESLNILIQNGKSSSHPLPAPPWAMRTVSAISLTGKGT